MSISYIVSQSKTITLYLDSDSFTVDSEDPLYPRIVGAIKAKDETLLRDLLQNPLSGVAEFVDGKVLYAGKELHNVLVARIIEQVSMGLDAAPMLRFLENLMANPSEQSRQELYEFLEHKSLPITEDGCFLGYKSIRHDWTDVYTGTFDNSIGAVHEMPRTAVDDDREKHCSFGFHVGTSAYAASFGPADRRIVLVKVNPKDAVSVPPDYSAQKLRCCKYEVVAEVAQETLDFPVYSSDGSKKYESMTEYATANWDEDDFSDLDDEEVHYFDELWDKEAEDTAELAKAKSDFVALKTATYREHTRDFVVAEAKRRELVSTIEAGRRIGKDGCIALLVGDDSQKFFED